MLFLSLHFGVISILVPSFLFYHFQSLIQLKLVILVISVSQQTEIADVANGLIKILIKIHCGSCHPCHLGFSPLYSHVTLTAPKSVPETQNPLNRSTFPQTKSVHLRSRFEIAIKPPQQTNKPPSQTKKPKNIYTQTHFSWNSREKKSRETCYCSEISISVR